MGEEYEQSRKKAGVKCTQLKQLISNLNRKPKKITKSVHKKVRLFNEKMIEEKLMKKVRKQLKNL